MGGFVWWGSRYGGFVWLHMCAFLEMAASQVKRGLPLLNYFTEMCSGSEEGSF